MDSWDVILVSLSSMPDDPGVSTFLWNIFKKEKFTDVEFSLDTQNGPVTISAHRLILSIWSPYFAKMFYVEGKGTLSPVRLKDVDPEAFKVMLRFMYGVEPDQLTHRKAFELYKVAVKFEVNSLSDLCCKFLSTLEVTVSNVFDILGASEYMHNESLRDRCLKLIQGDTKGIISHYECTDISPSMIGIILDSPKLSLDSEFELLLWIFAWAKNRYIENSQYSNIREAATEFLSQLHFTALTNTEFAMLQSFHHDFFTQDEVVGIFMNIAIRGSWPMPDWYDSKAEFREYTEKSFSSEEQASAGCDEEAKFTQLKTVD